MHINAKNITYLLYALQQKVLCFLLEFLSFLVLEGIDDTYKSDISCFFLEAFRVFRRESILELEKLFNISLWYSSANLVTHILKSVARISF